MSPHNPEALRDALADLDRCQIALDLAVHSAGTWPTTPDVLAALEALAGGAVHVERIERLLVAQGRAQGLSWADMASALDRSRQALWERYRGEVEP